METTPPTDQPTPESIGPLLAPLKAQQLASKIRAEIEVMTKYYGLGAFDMTYTDALGAATHVEWDGVNPPVFTPLRKSTAAA